MQNKVQSKRKSALKSGGNSSRLSDQQKKKNLYPSNTGTYVYDKKLNKVVKISDRIPKISSREAKEDSDFSESSPCGREECSEGTCAAGDAEWN